jgi:hypothetical protein
VEADPVCCCHPGQVFGIPQTLGRCRAGTTTRGDPAEACRINPRALKDDPVQHPRVTHHACRRLLPEWRHGYPAIRCCLLVASRPDPTPAQISRSEGLACLPEGARYSQTFRFATHAPLLAGSQLLLTGQSIPSTSTMLRKHMCSKIAAHCCQP